MNSLQERESLRRLTGGGSPRVRPRDGAATEIERLWAEIELPPTPGAPPGFRQRLFARAREEAAQRRTPWLPLAPAWARWASVAALVAGVGLGGTLAALGGSSIAAPESTVPGLAGASNSPERDWTLAGESLSEDFVNAAGEVDSE